MRTLGRSTTCLLCVLVLCGLYSGSSAEREEISCSNSYIASAVSNLLGNEVQCTVLADPEGDPKLEQVFPREVWDQIEKSRLLVYHPFQTWIIKAMDQRDNRQPVRVMLRSRFNPIVPGDYWQLVQELQKELTEQFPAFATYILERMETLQEMVKVTENETLGKIRQSNIYGISCVTARSQQRLAEWLGFKVIETYEDGESPSEVQIEKIRKKAAEYKARLVIGNRQGQGQEITEQLAASIGGIAVSFWGAPALESNGEIYNWQNLLSENVDLLLQTMK